MRKTTRVIKNILDDFKTEHLIKENLSKNKNSLILNLTFDFDEFYKYNHSVSNFFKKLTNNKNTLEGKYNNREWWSSLTLDGKNDGFYRYNITNEFVKIIIFLTVDKKINELELRFRIKKIIPKFKLQILENNDINLNEFLGDVFSLESGFSVFGDVNKTKNIS
jgi:hypothetical protein